MALVAIRCLKDGELPGMDIDPMQAKALPCPNGHMPAMLARMGAARNHSLHQVACLMPKLTLLPTSAVAYWEAHSIGATEPARAVPLRLNQGRGWMPVTRTMGLPAGRTPEGVMTKTT